jgi:alanine dehydrogenase
MRIGIPKEIKDNEYRVGLTPGGVHLLTDHGHEVFVENSAGVGSGFLDAEYVEAGATMLESADDVWGKAEMVVKVKEPQEVEYPRMRDDLLLFTYLHLAAEEKLTKAMLDCGVTGIAYETVETPNGHLPLLTPMSEVAGRMAVQVGAQSLEKMNGGRGKLLGGIPGVRPCDVVILGCGVVGTNAAKMAVGLGAHVIFIDRNLGRLREIDDLFPGQTTLAANPVNIAASVRRADLVVGAVLVKGAVAPKLVSRKMVTSMRDGSVIVDVAVDQGGCIETTHATTHSDPTFVVDGVVHYCVANMPGAVPRTSTYGLNNATQPYVLALADKGLDALREDESLAKGLNTYQGKLTYQAVAEAFDLEYTPRDQLLG